MDLLINHYYYIIIIIIIIIIIMIITSEHFETPWKIVYPMLLEQGCDV